MTLTRLLPTLRRSIPDPIEPDLWPAATDATITDVEVGGVSLLRLAELFGTPAVHLGRAVVPGSGSGSRPAAAAVGSTGVAVVRVLEASVDQGARTVTIDADLGPLDPAWTEARLIGRVSVARTTPTTIRATANVSAATSVTSAASGCLAPQPVDLPADLTVGDLLALPYAAVIDEAGVARQLSGWPTTPTERLSRYARSEHSRTCVSAEWMRGRANRPAEVTARPAAASAVALGSGFNSASSPPNDRMPRPS